MPLPTTNLTLHCDASVNTDVWQFFQGTAPYHNTTAADGVNVEVWDDVEHGGNAFIYQTSAPQGPTYRVNTPLMEHPCLDFDGSTEDLVACLDSGAQLQMSDLFGAGAKTVLIAFYPEAIASSAADPWSNVALMSDFGGNFGVHLKDLGGGSYSVMAYNWDGSADVVSASISLNTSYVVCLRHDGTNLYLSVNGGSESSVPSGNTATMTGTPVRLGANSDLGQRFNGRIGEVAFYNAALTGTNLSDAISYFTTKWVAGSSTTKVQEIVLRDESGAPLANLTNLKCYGWDTNVPANVASSLPTDYTATGSTNASGVLTFTRTNTTLVGGNVAFMLVTTSDGTTTQVPRSFFAPVAITEV